MELISYAVSDSDLMENAIDLQVLDINALEFVDTVSGYEVMK